MNTTENNKIIAEFMEWEYKVLPVYSDDKFLGRKNIYNTPFKKHLKNKAFTTTFSENELVFHNDWNWLMEVVEKCFKIEANYGLHKNIEDALIFNSEIRIYDVYNAVVKFIEVYNESFKQQAVYSIRDNSAKNN